MPPIKNAFTTAAAAKTLGEIQALLASKGVSSLSVRYEEGEPAGLDFSIIIEVKGERRTISFRLPANIDGVERVLRSSKRRELHSRERARATAWRNVLAWTQAQFALIEAGQAQLAQVFLPYAVTEDSRTLFEHFEGEGLPRLLGPAQ
jgi:hypothetical protein